MLIHDQADEGNMAIAWGTHTTVAHNDEVVTGLDTVDHVMVSLKSEPTFDNTLFVSALPSVTTAGSVTITGQMATGAADVTPVDATTFGKLVTWVAFGTKK